MNFPAETVTSYDSNPELVPLLCPVKTVAQSVPVSPVWMSNRALRRSPLYQAILTWRMFVREPSSYRTHCPSPSADQRVAREPSIVLDGTLPSSALADTETLGSRLSASPFTLPAQAATMTTDV